VVTAQDPIVEDGAYLQQHLGRERPLRKPAGREPGQHAEDFFLSELCWAKRFDAQRGRTEWWPGMVTDSETRSLKTSRKTTYTVHFFALDEDAEIHERSCLPFLPYCE
jgi:hypothetical protein